MGENESSELKRLREIIRYLNIGTRFIPRCIGVWLHKKVTFTFTPSRASRGHLLSPWLSHSVCVCVSLTLILCLLVIGGWCHEPVGALATVLTLWVKMGRVWAKWRRNEAVSKTGLIKKQRLLDIPIPNYKHVSKSNVSQCEVHMLLLSSDRRSQFAASSSNSGWPSGLLLLIGRSGPTKQDANNYSGQAIALSNIGERSDK